MPQQYSTSHNKDQCYVYTLIRISLKQKGANDIPLLQLMVLGIQVCFHWSLLRIIWHVPDCDITAPGDVRCWGRANCSVNERKDWALTEKNVQCPVG